MANQSLQVSGYRLRRTHEKSRNGCLRCKQQRKKCDEKRPSCSRCTKRSYTCRYPFPLSDDNLSEEPESAAHSPVSDLHVISGPESPVSPSHHLRLSDSTPDRDAQISSQSRSSTDEARLDPCRLGPQPPEFLDATELSLLAHYLTHTSHIIPVDQLDLYALSVGVPNLAFRSKAVMSSLLALAAACQSHDIAKQALTPQSLLQIRELLGLAERHHRASLRHIQESMQSPEMYDHVLANAALMVLYASASHSIRVHLAATAKQRGQRLPGELLPQHSQWISFTRAAHTASTAVLNDIVNAAKGASPIMPTEASLSSTDLHTPGVLTPQDGPSEHTKRLFLPVVASTYTQAFERLRKRAEATVTLLKNSNRSCNMAQLHASLETVSILEHCAAAALTSRQTPATRPRTQALALHKRARVSPWVAKYMISVTSMEAPQVLRRIIMSFLNKAPTEYLGLVQSVLDSSSTGREGSATAEVGALTTTHVLAMDIFAHWLVLVMLLDGVWWIGGIGQWELGQVLAVLKTQDPLGLAETGETWWPESMYLVKRELSPSAP
ncbi:putative C6 transcription factor [Aspergillus uvarum CBS 121591]|uniref:Putative C6 transcription factor n=1 Tax=Aspergillus uvarum CBS 121591 TaxID=1448315 RepID=A0A319D485_9EURO|nr:putative C6 transcription factor [Aspergillus uvarum CBS 121591]PYH85833.1 putative C6 transcription factor [Aspergillus uvarum CBS 121591]